MNLTILELVILETFRVPFWNTQIHLFWLEDTRETPGCHPTPPHEGDFLLQIVSCSKNDFVFQFVSCSNCGFVFQKSFRVPQLCIDSRIENEAPPITPFMARWHSGVFPRPGKMGFRVFQNGTRSVSKMTKSILWKGSEIHEWSLKSRTGMRL